MSESSKLKTKASVIGVSSPNIRKPQSIKRQRHVSHPFYLSERTITAALLSIAFLLLCALIVNVPIDPQDELPLKVKKVSLVENASKTQFQSLEPEMKQLNANIEELVGVLKNSAKVSPSLHQSTFKFNIFRSPQEN